MHVVCFWCICGLLFLTTLDWWWTDGLSATETLTEADHTSTAWRRIPGSWPLVNRSFLTKYLEVSFIKPSKPLKQCLCSYVSVFNWVLPAQCLPKMNLFISRLWSIFNEFRVQGAMNVKFIAYWSKSYANILQMGCVLLKYSISIFAVHSATSTSLCNRLMSFF